MLTFLLNFLILLVAAIAVFYVIRFVLDAAEAEPPLRKLVLLIFLLVFLVAVLNLLGGGFVWGRIVVVN